MMFIGRVCSVKLFLNICKYSEQRVPKALRSKKVCSTRPLVQTFLDLKRLRAVGGRGGEGCISFLSVWSNEFAGPDGGDGGHGGHVIFKASNDVKDLSHLPTVIRAENGVDGQNKDCHGRNADHCVVNVPVGTVIKTAEGTVVGDLQSEGLMFVAARGGAGGRGNHFFITATEQAPEICEYGAAGENFEYCLEIKGMAHVGLIGFPNAGKSTFLRAVSRARPKVAPYPFTTLKPYVGMVHYDDYEQIAIADLPGLIPESHKNKGLGIQFLKHVERCAALLYIIDLSAKEPWQHLFTLQHELSQFNENLLQRPQLIIGNKIDLPESKHNFKLMENYTELKVIPISAKMGTNLGEVLRKIRIIYDKEDKK